MVPDDPPRPDLPGPHLPGPDTAPLGFEAADEGRHGESPVEEWWFSCWSVDGTCGLLSGWRIVRDTGWYWAALARRGAPLIHMAEWAVPLRADPFLAKAPEMWAEIECVSPFAQWTIGNEMYAAALDDAEDALGRAHGHRTPFAMDLEWYATSPATALEDVSDERGYLQAGVVHGVVERPDGPVEWSEAPASRWHRWGATLGDAPLPAARAHRRVRAPVRFPDGTASDLVLLPDGWCRRSAADVSAVATRR